ncbi:MAG: DUF6691 family protein [Alphaproteobacteria bacterium]
MYLFSAAISGFLFGAGLYISQMTDPTKVISFLDLTRIPKGNWDPSLVFVMAGGFAVMAVAHLIRKRAQHPVAATKFQLPTSIKIDKSLVLGSAIFGIGWGIAGYCPGPAIASLAFLPQTSFIFVFGLMLGSFGSGIWLKRKTA